MWIHGFASRGIIGPIGGTVTARRVDIAYNGAAGWDFDDGKATPNVNGVINLSYVTIEWSGCNQAYPGTGAITCYGQSNGGYGDGIGTPGWNLSHRSCRPLRLPLQHAGRIRHAAQRYRKLLDEHHRLHPTATMEPSSSGDPTTARWSSPIMSWSPIASGCLLPCRASPTPTTPISRLLPRRGCDRAGLP